MRVDYTFKLPTLVFGSEYNFMLIGSGMVWVFSSLFFVAFFLVVVLQLNTHLTRMQKRGQIQEVSTYFVYILRVPNFHSCV